MDLQELRLATFNLFNLNEPGLPMYQDSTGWTQEEYDRKIAWSATRLRELKPDVMGFQELWNAQSLSRIMQFGMLGDQYDVLAPPWATGVEIVCAAIVRKGLLSNEPEWIKNFPEKFRLSSTGDDAQTPEIEVRISGFSRPLLHFTIKPRSAKSDIHIYVCHLKSKNPTQVYKEPWFASDKALYQKHATALGSALSTIRRTAEAAALRFLLNEQMKNTDTPVIVLGDLNDSQTSNTVNILTEQPRYLVGDSKGGSDVALYAAQTLQEYRDTRDVYYTNVFQDMRESLDHILVSQEFYDHSRKRIWLFDGMIVDNDHLNYEDHKANGTNDHGLIRATFKFKPIATP